MFKGYLGFGDVELVNVARLVKYAAEGAAPRDVRIEPMVGDYSDLAAALGDAAYRNAILDSPPWYDPTNPDSAFFAGLLPLDVTGLDGSTRGRTVIEGLDDGGNPTRARATSRTIGVTALAVANGDAALDAGLGWLTGVLHPPCASAPDSCRGVPLSLFSAAPVYCDQLPDYDAEPVEQTLIAEPIESHPGPTLTYYELHGSYLSPVCGPVTITAIVRRPEDDTYDPLGRTVTLVLQDSTGTVYASTSATVPADGDPVTLTLTYDPSPGFPADWQPVLYWYGPAVIDGGDGGETEIEDVFDGGGADPVPELIDGADADGPWTAGGSWGGALGVDEWTIARYPLLTVEDCLSELRRSYRNVVTVSGPTVVEELLSEDGEPYAAKVEWTWVATDPVPYGDTIPLLTRMMVARLGGSVYAASEGSNIDLAAPYFAGGFFAGLFMMDGALIPDGATVLIKDQDDPEDNGLYVWPGPFGSLTRSPLMDAWDTEVVGANYAVLNGAQAGTVWETTATPGGVLGTTPIVWVESVSSGGGVYDDAVAYSAPGIQVGDNTDVDGGDTACPIPAPELVLCGDDPLLPALVAPPAAPTLPDAGMVTVADYVRREFQVPPALSPQPGGVLTFTFTSLAASAYRGIRVRLWADDDPDFGVDDECAWEYEFWLTYLAPGQTVTVNGPDQEVTTTCLSGLDADHERNVRGAYGGPFTFPELRCGARYHIAIDVPSADDAGIDPGDAQGVLVDVAVTRRGV